MSAYYFRVVDEDGTPNGYVGMVCARDKTELFWTIDEFVDPYSVEICAVKNGGICMRQKITTYEDDDEDDVVYSDYEHTESFPLFNEAINWKRPDWSTVESIYAR